MAKRSVKYKKAAANKKKKTTAAKGKKRAWPARTLDRLAQMKVFVERTKEELERSGSDEDILADCAASITYIDGLIEQIGKLPADWKPKGTGTRGVLQVGDVVTFKDDTAAERYAFLQLTDVQFTIQEVFDVRSVLVVNEDGATTLILKRHLKRM